MNTKSKLSIICALAFVGIIIGNIGLADTSTVTATVTIGDVQVTLTPTSFSYGTMPLNTSKKSFNVINEGNGVKNIEAEVGSVVTNLEIKGDHTASWQLEGSSGEDQYVHKFGKATNGATEPASYTALTTTYTTLETGLIASGSVFLG
ncbi:MAG: hypothetical protein PHG13_00085 [Candidatus Pacebacteria bacterium]|nr:hypothetical protein [Candidatus Paceibacterota bacterium]MDD5721676.1 hypothetical protein [Candidatus Paceibacterota bacterium]